MEIQRAASEFTRRVSSLPGFRALGLASSFCEVRLSLGGLQGERISLQPCRRYLCRRCGCLAGQPLVSLLQDHVATKLCN